MRKLTNQEYFALAWRLYKAGCPLQFGDGLKSGSIGLRIEQVGGVRKTRRHTANSRWLSSRSPPANSWTQRFATRGSETAFCAAYAHGCTFSEDSWGRNDHL
jgi:hypothetical protein